jgi:2-polyprenyl-6-hydroxyphenyl methylase/3-demethylubiquinone-9 3-methyltransferase
MKDVIEHAPDDDALFEAAAQAIAPGGNIVISTQNALSLNYLVQGTYHRVLRGEKSWYGWDPTHIRFYTPGLLKTKLTSAGFDIVAWRSVYIVPYKLPAIPGFGRRFLRIDAMSRLDQILGRIFPYNRLGWNIIVKAEAPPLASLKVPVITSLKRQLQPL